MYITCIHSYPNIENKFFSVAHGIFSRINYFRPQNKSINLKRTEIIASVFSDHDGMKLEINYTKKTGKFTNVRRLTKMLLNNQWVKEEAKEKSKNTETNKNGNTPKFVG